MWVAGPHQTLPLIGRVLGSEFYVHSHNSSQHPVMGGVWGSVVARARMDLRANWFHPVPLFHDAVDEWVYHEKPIHVLKRPQLTDEV